MKLEMYHNIIQNMISASLTHGPYNLSVIASFRALISAFVRCLLTLQIFHFRLLIVRDFQNYNTWIKMVGNVCTHIFKSQGRIRKCVHCGYIYIHHLDRKIIHFPTAQKENMQVHYKNCAG